jgi:hypothetical protein
MRSVILSFSHFLFLSLSLSLFFLFPYSGGGEVISGYSEDKRDIGIDNGFFSVTDRRKFLVLSL